MSEIHFIVVWPQFYRGIFGNVHYMTRCELFMGLLENESTFLREDASKPNLVN